MSSAAQSKQGEGQVKFGPFDVSTQVFARNEVAVALVNIKPIVPGREWSALERDAHVFRAHKQQLLRIRRAGDSHPSHTSAVRSSTARHCAFLDAGPSSLLLRQAHLHRQQQHI